jgi:hypothetical protein
MDVSLSLLCALPSFTHPANRLAERLYVESVWTRGPSFELGPHCINARLIDPTLRHGGRTKALKQWCHARVDKPAPIRVADPGKASPKALVNRRAKRVDSTAKLSALIRGSAQTAVQ